MKLYGTAKSRSFRCVWAAEEAGLDIEYVPVALGSSEANGSQTADYRKIHFQGKVPALTDGKIILTESAAIVNYLAKQSADKTLIPDDLSPERARYDELCFFVLSDLEQPLWTNGKHRFAIPKEHRVAEVLPTTLWEFNKSQKALINLIGEKPEYAIGTQFTMADILIAHTLNWAESFKLDILPSLADYKNRHYSRPACLAALKKIGL